jgi:hypothetical protein
MHLDAFLVSFSCSTACYSLRPTSQAILPVKRCQRAHHYAAAATASSSYPLSAANALLPLVVDRTRSIDAAEERELQRATELQIYRYYQYYRYYQLVLVPTGWYLVAQVLHHWIVSTVKDSKSTRSTSTSTITTTSTTTDVTTTSTSTAPGSASNLTNLPLPFRPFLPLANSNTTTGPYRYRYYR